MVEEQGNDKLINLETYLVHMGGTELPDDEKAVRRALKLPVTKQLVFYFDAHNADSRVDVSEYWIERITDITEPWCVIGIRIQGKQEVRIHSSYFAEMQKPSFITDMANQEKAIE